MAWSGTLIHNDAQYDAALAEYESFFDNEPAAGSAEADRFQLLGLVLAKYEEERFTDLPEVEPIEVVKFAMQAAGRTQADLADLLGSRSRASELLSGRRSLSLDQLRKLSRVWRIPVGALIGVRKYA